MKKQKNCFPNHKNIYTYVWCVSTHGGRRILCGPQNDRRDYFQETPVSRDVAVSYVTFNFNRPRRIYYTLLGHVVLIYIYFFYEFYDDTLRRGPLRFFSKVFLRYFFYTFNFYYYYYSFRSDDMLRTLNFVRNYNNLLLAAVSSFRANVFLPSPRNKFRHVSHSYTSVHVRFFTRTRVPRY